MAQFLAESRPLQTLDILDLENEAGLFGTLANRLCQVYYLPHVR